MTLAAQARALAAAFSSPGKVRGRTGSWLIVFFLAAAMLVALTGRAAFSAEDRLLSWVLGYVLPARWSAIARGLIDGLWSQEIEAVLINGVLAGSLLLISTVLLPLRERISLAFEREAALTDEPAHGEGLGAVVVEIGVAGLIFVTAQLILLGIGYSRDPFRRGLAATLSYVFLFVSCAMELIPPLWARHGVRLAAGLRTLARVPLLTVAFGAMFAAPGLLAAALASGARPLWRLALLVTANVLGVAWGTLGGTLLAGRLFAEARRPPPSTAARGAAWTILLVLFFACTYVAGAAALAVEHKSQILKCKFHLVPSSVGMEMPDVGALVHKRLATTAQATIEITNPTEHDVVIEASRLEIARGGMTVARMALNPGAVPAGQTTRYPIEAPIVIDAKGLRRALMIGRSWQVTLFVRVAPGVELPIFLSDGG